MSSPVTLYLADDHQIVIDGLKLLIGSIASVKILGYGNNVVRAKADILNWKPDLALIDLRMPGPQLNGLDLIHELNKLVATKFIILSMHDEQRFMRDAKAAGAFGYLLKNAGQYDLQKCLYAVMAGDQYFPDMRKVIANPGSPFTPRETEILKLVLQDHTTAEIADLLSLAYGTVVTHRKNICRKTNESTPLGFIKFLREHSIEL